MGNARAVPTDSSRGDKYKRKKTRVVSLAYDMPTQTCSTVLPNINNNNNKTLGGHRGAQKLYMGKVQGQITEALISKGCHFCTPTGLLDAQNFIKNTRVMASTSSIPKNIQ